jgi:hypothetical protein
MEQTNTHPSTASPTVLETRKASTEMDGPQPPNPFDPARLRLPQNFAAASGVRRLLTTVLKRKPVKGAFVRTHPDDAYRMQAAVLELKEEREIYLVHPSLLEALAGESTVSPRLLVTTITRQGALSLWPLRLPDQNGRLDNWGRSALEAAEVAKRRWVRVDSNISAGCYDVLVAPEGLAQPDWPEASFADLLKLAFRDTYIDNLNHAVLRTLRGEL